ncbi:MAG: hypothetical protein ACM3NQ_09710 [Bacteroidales bacterium]
MRRIIGVVICVAIVLSAASLIFAQTKTITGEKQTITATIENIEASSRTVTLKGPEGNYVTIVVPADVKRFNEFKVGDKITATYYENVVLRVKREGEKTVDTDKAALTRSGGAPGATAATQRTITATITAIDPKIPSITFSGPNNWKYSSKVADKEALAKVKVGDKVDITWTEAMLVSLEPPAPAKKK